MNDVEIRELRPEDSTRLWEIRNSESVRHRSHTTDPIAREKHDEWFTQYIANPRNHGFVITCSGEVAGYCRIDDGLVSIAVAPEYQGRGYSKTLLVEAVRRTQSHFDHITAEVRRDNTISYGLFLAAGFSVIEQDAEKFVFVFPAPGVDGNAQT